MKNQFKSTMLPLLLTTNFLVYQLSSISQSVRDDVTSRVYDAVKLHADNFPAPIPFDTIFVGTFDHTTGQFEGMVGSDEYFFNGRKNVKYHAAAYSNSEAANTVLVFRPKFGNVRLRVTINNKEYTAESNGAELWIPIRSQSYINWKVGIYTSTKSVFTESYRDVLRINRKKFYGMGVYTMPYLPVCIVYAPPVTGYNENIISYTERSVVGTTLQLSSSKEISESKPVMSPLNQLYGALDMAIETTSNAHDPYTQIANSALSAIRSAFGNKEETITSGKLTENGQEITSIYENSETHINIIPTAGPGHSDQFIILKNVRVIWMVTDSKFTYTLLDYSDRLSLKLDDMRASNDADLQSLISLDVFALTGPTSPRYTKLPRGGGYGIGVPLKFSISKSDILRNTSSVTSYKTRITEYTSGTLGFLGIGYDEDKTIKQTFSHGFSNTTSIIEEKISEINIINKTSGVTYFEVYYDNLFGTIAVYLVPKNKAGGVSSQSGSL